MATYVNDLRLKEIATGDEAGTWGTSTNTNLELIAEAFSFGTEAITTNADTHTTTIADGSTDPGRSIYLKYTGTLDSACTITIGPNTVSKLWFIENGTSGSQNIIISQGSGANVTVPAGEVKAIYSDGAGSGAAMVDAFAGLKVSDAAQTNITSLGTLTTLTVDDITINGSTISDSGDLTIDVGGDIIFDADGGDITFKDGGTSVGAFDLTGGFAIKSTASDADFFIQGNDGGSAINALSFDMSAAGKATFNSDIVFGSVPITSAVNVLKAVNTGENGFLIRSAVSSAANPSYSNVDDTNTGMFLPGSDVIGFTTGGSEHARITSNVSIGTTTSTAPLNVQCDGSARGIRIIGRDNGTSDEAALTFADNGNNTTVDIITVGNALTFFQGGTENMRLTDAGLLQLGTAIANSTYAGLFNGVSNVGTGAIIQTRNGDGKKHFMLRGDNNVEYGSVGLSASSGSASLQLQGENTIVFNTNTDSERIRIDSSGVVLIGKSNNDVTGAGHKINDNGETFHTANTTSVQNTLHVFDQADSAYRFYVGQAGSGAGNIYATNTSITAISDERLKENIKDLETGLSEVMSLKPRRFDWKQGEGSDIKNVAGFIAQEVETVLPDLIGNYLHEELDDAKSVRMGDMIPTLVKAIQEQQEQIDALQSEIQSLKGE
jgi:hypothetical protein